MLKIVQDILDHNRGAPTKRSIADDGEHGSDDRDAGASYRSLLLSAAKGNPSDVEDGMDQELVERRLKSMKRRNTHVKPEVWVYLTLSQTPVPEERGCGSPHPRFPVWSRHTRHGVKVLFHMLTVIHLLVA